MHGMHELSPDSAYVRGLANELRAHYSRHGLLELYGRFGRGYGTLRRILWAALVRSSWIAIHEYELMADWALAANGEPVFPIEPLR
jgi:hypothetical protein